MRNEKKDNNVMNSQNDECDIDNSQPDDIDICSRINFIHNDDDINDIDWVKNFDFNSYVY